LFSGAGAVNGSTFSSIQSTAPGTTFGFGNGVLTVLSSTASNPTNITYSVSGNTLSLAWPSDHLGWTLYTNSVGIAASTQWFPFAGSSTVTTMNLPINHNGPNVYFRLQLH